MAMELSCRTERFDSYRGNLRDSAKRMKKTDYVVQKVSSLEMKSSFKASRIRQMELRVSQLTENLKEEHRHDLLEGMRGHREQFLLTP